MAASDRLPASAVLSPEQLRATAESIAAEQWADGGIPWFRGGHLDPWDHVEAAMALSAAGLTDAATAAYTYCAATQRPDGSWPMIVRTGGVEDAAADTNQCAYIAVGVWHHYLVTADAGFLTAMWSTVRRAIDYVLGVQRPGGELAWAVNAYGVPETEALLTGSASVVQSLRCACAIATALGLEPLRWRRAAARLAHAVRAHPELFADRSRWSMDWYYPVLTGAVRGSAGQQLLAHGWRTFVSPGWGVRCVSDRPWYTVAESCELVLALHAVGDVARGRKVFADVQHLRAADGGYWTGYVVDEELVWPEERTTWTAAAVILAADALTGTTPAADLFRDAGPLDDEDAGCGCLTAGGREETLG
ncbi:MAG TPA: hypothetical protein VI248_04835 [Kineosporiaceae bacterium]